MRDEIIDSRFLFFLSFFLMVAMLIFSSYSSEGTSLRSVIKVYILNKIWLLGICCPWIYVAVYLTTARKIDLTGFNIISGICWHMEMKNTKTMKSLIYRSNPILAHSKGLSSLLYWNCVLMLLPKSQTGIFFIIMGFAIQMSISIDFYVVQFIVKIIAKKKIIMYLKSPFSQLWRHILLWNVLPLQMRKIRIVSSVGEIKFRKWFKISVASRFSHSLLVSSSSLRTMGLSLGPYC